MIMVADARRLVAVALVQIRHRRAIRLREAVNGITIERIRHRHAFADLSLEMQRRDVVVVIICSSAMPTPLIQLANLLSHLTTIVLGIEDRHAIHRQSNGSAQKAALDHRRFLCRHRLERNLPGIVVEILLRQRHLLLPGRDADHHVMIGQAIRTHVKKLAIRPQIELHEGQEGLRRRWCGGFIR